jgi:hypothetical protein
MKRLAASRQRQSFRSIDARRKTARQLYPAMSVHKKNALLLLGSCVFALLLAEFLLRLMDYFHVSFYEPSICCGTALIPNTEGWWRREGEAYIRINSAGLRDREHAIAKPPNTLRIAILGDSYAEAFQVPMERAFWSVLERTLPGCQTLRGKNLEVINFGVSGYGTAQALQTLRHKVWPYQPDIVVLAFVSGNDVRNNSRSLERDGTRPYFVYENGTLVYDDAFLEDPAWLYRNSGPVRFMNALMNRSRLLQLVYQIKHSDLFRFPAAQAADRPGHSALSQEPGLDDTIYRAPATKAWRDAWAVTEGLIELMNKETLEHGADLLLVTLSNGIQVHPDQDVRRNYTAHLEVDDLFYPDRRLASLAERLGVPHLMLAPRLHRWAEANQTCVHGFANATQCGGHWNATGHRLAGEWIADRICRTGTD